MLIAPHTHIIDVATIIIVIIFAILGILIFIGHIIQEKEKKKRNDIVNEMNDTSSDDPTNLISCPKCKSTNLSLRKDDVGNIFVSCLVCSHKFAP